MAEELADEVLIDKIEESREKKAKEVQVVEKTIEPKVEEKPEVKHIESVYENNDHYWDLLWHKIDRAQHLVAIATYDMDHKTVAGITL